jgi:hypothetical protein
VTPDNVLVTGDATYGPWNGLSEYTDLGDGLWIGQAHDFLAALVWDGSTLRVLETGACTFIRANRAGEAVTIALSKPEGVVLLSTTMAELRALPPVVTPPVPPVEPPVPPVPPDPPVPPKPPEPPIPPIPPTPPRARHRGVTMTDLVGKTVVLRGPKGLLMRPDAPNTGTWASLNQGWRGAVFTGTDSSIADYRHTVVAVGGRYAFVNEVTRSVAGADATHYSGAVDKQVYYKPDGDSDTGDYEQFRCYDGNENGAIEAQIEHVTDDQADAGAGHKFFAYPLSVEVVA